MGTRQGGMPRWGDLRVNKLLWKAGWYWRELTQPRLDGRRGLGGTCDHKWNEGDGDYDLLLTLIRIWKFSIGRCDHCKAKIVKWGKE